MSGWIKLHRSSLKTDALEDWDARGLWDWMLLQAAHKPTVAYRGKGGRPVALEPGQLVLSASSIPRMSEKRARTILARFERARMIYVASRRDVGRIITISNWLEYQEELPQGVRQGRNKGETRAKQGRTAQEVQESKKQTPTESVSAADAARAPDPVAGAFDAFWQVAVRKDDKRAAQRAFAAAAKRAPVDVIMAAWLDDNATWRDWPPDERQFVPQPRKWLHNDRWEGQRAQARRAACGYDPAADPNSTENQMARLRAHYEQEIARELAGEAGGGADRREDPGVVRLLHFERRAKG